MSWFDVDRKGLQKLALERGVAFVLFELFSNAQDEDVTYIDLTFAHMEGRQYMLDCEDDSPEGFRNLSHAYTLFAESDKKGKPQKAGRFNLGEKLVLAVCSEAEIVTTKGHVRFNENGERTKGHKRREKGTVFHGMIKNLITKEEWEEACKAFMTVIPRPGVKVRFSTGPWDEHFREIEPRIPLHSIQADLQTVISDDDGMLRRKTMNTLVEIFEPKPGEEPMLYELGVPVVPTKDKWHVNIHQKVPLNKDRDNVPPDFLAKVRTLVVNAMHDKLTADDMNKPWVTQATESPDIRPEAMKKFMDEKFGEKRVSYDPSDPESNSLAAVHQHNVVHGSMMSKDQWENARKNNLIKPAGQVTPSPKAFSCGFGPDGTPLKQWPEDKITEGMDMVRRYAMWLHVQLGLGPLGVLFLNDDRMIASAAYAKGSKVVEFNMRKLRPGWFELGAVQHVNDLLLDEFGHAFSDNHHSIDYHRALRSIGAKMFEIALKYPKKIRTFRKEPTEVID
jgi:hypothetical protein